MGRPIVVVALIVLAGFTVGAPQRAEAACGDYLSYRGSPDHGSGMTHNETDLHSQDDPSDQEDHRPCHGPGCRKAPLPAPAAPAPVEWDVRPDVAAILGRDSRAPRSGGDLLTTDSDTPAAGHPVALLRPPAAC